jgi:hypothetical protein
LVSSSCPEAARASVRGERSRRAAAPLSRGGRARSGIGRRIPRACERVPRDARRNGGARRAGSRRRPCARMGGDCLRERQAVAGVRRHGAGSRRI